MTNRPPFPALRGCQGHRFSGLKPGRPQAGWDEVVSLYTGTHTDAPAYHAHTPECSVTHEAQGLVSLRLGRGERGSLGLNFPHFQAAPTSPIWFVCSAILLTCPDHLAFLPSSKEAQLELRPQGPVISRKQQPPIPDSPIAASKRKDETPRSLPGPGKLGLCPSHPHGHTRSPHTSPISLGHGMESTLCPFSTWTIAVIS